ncbi:TIGR01777 family oxidoreductase [Paenibacillus senegalensis]|uniref:TIGR01777 family oxidoreductase n=1 Tax=Paenibacillus senegalensis TaxID=1465766 RepID=UPI000288E8B2|nr:TIGR01777 family oxidoreductase [Paenibacillus senegalensis]
MKVLVTGGTGFIGSHLVRHLREEGDDVYIVSRHHSDDPRILTWDEWNQNPSAWDGIEAVVNLAGETINQRWTAPAKERIVQSRLQAAEQLAEGISQWKVKPKVVINGSAIGIYGVSENTVFDERNEPRANDFLANVVRQWEEAAEQIPCERLVKIRLGLVLGRNEGALGKMKLPYLLGAGGRLGAGRQWMSWIHVEDVVRLISFCLRTRSAAGAVNATAPRPVTNDEFGRTLGKVLKRPHWLPVPEFVFKLLFGELSMLLIKGQKVFPWKAKEWGFEYTYPYLEAALAELLKKAP